MFLRDAWYVAAWSAELQDQPLGRTICDESVLVMRIGDAKIAAMSNVCPHRFASLSMGARVGEDRIQCPYHGLEFDSAGACVHNPHGNGALPHAIRLQTYPAIERFGLIWLWLGDSGKADEALIPDFSCLTDPRYRTLTGTLDVDAHYELLTDNLMDLSHVEYLHRGILGSEAISRGRHEVRQDGETFHSNRWCPDGLAPPAWDAMYDHYGKPVDHWLDMRWNAPAHMLLDVGVTPTGRPRADGIMLWGTDILTPMTATSTRYFWAISRDFALDRDDMDQVVQGAIDVAFSLQDKPMVEEVQRNMKGRTFDEMRPLLMPFDTGAVRVRRFLAAKIRGNAEPDTVVA